MKVDLVRANGSDTGFEPTNDWTSHLTHGNGLTLCGKPVGRTLVADASADMVPNCHSCAVTGAMLRKMTAGDALSCCGGTWAHRSTCSNHRHTFDGPRDCATCRGTARMTIPEGRDDRLGEADCEVCGRAIYADETRCEDHAIDPSTMNADGEVI